MATDFIPDLNSTRKHLQDFAVGWGSNAYIASQVAPVIHKSGPGSMNGKFPIWGMEQKLKQDTTFGRAGKPKRRTRTYREKNYDCLIKALAEELSPMDIDQADPELSFWYEGQRIIEMLKESEFINWESEVVTILSNDALYASGLHEDMDSASNRNFDDASGPGALALLLEFKDKAAQKCGVMPDTLSLSRDTFRLMRTDGNFFGGGSQNVKLSEEDIRELVGVDRVLVGTASNSTQVPKRDGDYTLADIWPSNGAWFTISPSQPTRNTPCTMKTFTADPDDSFTRGEKVNVFFDEENGASGMYEYRYQHCRDVQAVGLNPSNLIISGAYIENCYISL